MNKQSFMAPIIGFFISLFFFMPCLAFADGPVDVVHSVADQMIASLRDHKATLHTDPLLVYSLAYKIVIPHADLDTMAQRVLPPQTWNSSSLAQRTQFKKEFTTLLVRTYASALANYTDETVRFFPVRGGTDGKSTVKVNSEIVRSDGPPIGVSYQLVSKGPQWKLYDMSVEGISMLESFRSQFADKLERGDISELIAALKAHNAQGTA